MLRAALFAAITILRDSALAASGSSLTSHLPVESTLADLVCPPKLTVTVSPESPNPQIGTGFSRCKTMWSQTGAARRNSAAKMEATLNGKMVRSRVRAGE